MVYERKPINVKYDPNLIETCLEKLLAMRTASPRTKVDLPLDDIYELIRITREVLLQQDMLIQTNAPICICGDTHGQYYDLMTAFEKMGTPAGKRTFVFLGDYVLTDFIGCLRGFNLNN